MPTKSWIHLATRDPRLALSRDLAAAHGGAPDEGWVEQAVVAIERLSREDDVVLDPFAGYGTTLVACALTGRRGIGIEIDAARVRTIEARLATSRLEGADRQRVLHADACEPPLAEGSVALVVGSIPYFGHVRATTAPAPRQLYAAARYEDWLSLLDRAIGAMERVLAPGGRTALFVENVRSEDGALVPMAWDAARVLGRRLVLRDEWIIVYDREVRAAESADAMTTDRAHEYVLVAEKRS